MFMCMKGNGELITNSKQYSSSGFCLKLRFCDMLLWTLGKYLSFNMKGYIQMWWTILHITWLILCRWKHPPNDCIYHFMCFFSSCHVKPNLVPAWQKHCLYWFMSVEISNETELRRTKALWKSLSRNLNFTLTALIEQSTWPCKVAAASWYHWTSPNQICWKRFVSSKEYTQLLHSGTLLKFTSSSKKADVSAVLLSILQIFVPQIHTAV